jgi:hypothetical protein
MRISLNTAEQKLSQFIAKCRYENARKRGIVNAKMGDQDDWSTDLNGIGAEIAFAKLMNVYPDLTTDNSHLPDYDCIVGGYKVDVKTTTRENGRLLATLKKKTADIDVFALVVGTFPNYNYIGRATHGELCDDENIIDLRHGKGYGLRQNQLTNGLKS